MKKIYLLIIVLSLAYACTPDENVTPDPTEEEIINKDENGVIAESADLDLLVDGNNIGQLSVSLLRDSIFVDYNLNPDVIATELKFHVATARENLPATSGVLAPASFSFSEKDLRMPLSKIAGSSKFKGNLFFAFFCKISFIKAFSEEEVVDAKIKSTHSLNDPSYFKAVLTSGNVKSEFLAYCLQGDQSMDTAYVHKVKRISSLTKNKTLLGKTVDVAENLDLVNWVVNQDPAKWTRTDGNPANGADRQMAIWKLIEKTGNPTGVNIAGKFDITTVNKIVKDAKAQGENFKPKCGSKVICVLHKGPIGSINAKGTYNSGAYADPDYQVTGIVNSIECFGPEHLLWALGKKFNPEDIGTYFVMYKN